MKTQRPLIIGIAGGTGSGKTTVAKKIKDHFGQDVLYIPHDNYYKDQSELSLKERAKTNYDHPTALDTDLLVQHVETLILGKSIQMPLYDFATSNRMKETTMVFPKPVIIVEGILIFEHEKLRELMDIKIYVDTDADIRLGRRIKRDIQERGRTIEYSLNQYLSQSRPMHLAFGEPSKKYADIILPEGGENKVGLQMIIHSIENRGRKNTK